MALADGLTTKDNLNEKKLKMKQKKQPKPKKPTVDFIPNDQLKSIRIRKSEYFKNNDPSKH